MLRNPGDNYVALRRHYQFSDMHNGSWYLEIIPGPTASLFIMQEVRNGHIVKRTREAKPFRELEKMFWDRTFRMSLEAGNESEPPKVVLHNGRAEYKFGK